MSRMVNKQELNHLFKKYAKEDYSFFLEYTSHNAYKHSKHTELLCDVLNKVEKGKLKRVIVSMPP